MKEKTKDNLLSVTGVALGIVGIFCIISAFYFIYTMGEHDGWNEGVEYQTYHAEYSSFKCYKEMDERIKSSCQILTGYNSTRLDTQ